MTAIIATIRIHLPIPPFWKKSNILAWFELVVSFIRLLFVRTYRSMIRNYLRSTMGEVRTKKAVNSETNLKIDCKVTNTTMCTFSLLQVYAFYCMILLDNAEYSLNLADDRL